ncbi:MAG: outer membrane beta-barrel protein [Terracidiphilus sp.]
MRLKLFVGLVLALLFASTAYSAQAQAVPAALGPKDFSPVAIGVGFSGYNPDQGHGPLFGGTLWIDYIPDRVPPMLRGLGVEAEARDLSLDRSATSWLNMKIDYAGGGLIYSWPHFRSFRPYVKTFMGYGNVDDSFNPHPKNYGHASRTVASVGGGLDYQAFRYIWVRADYEYQTWPSIFNPPPRVPSGRLNPQGFTIGAMYHF